LKLIVKIYYASFANATFVLISDQKYIWLYKLFIVFGVQQKIFKPGNTLMLIWWVETQSSLCEHLIFITLNQVSLILKSAQP